MSKDKTGWNKYRRGPARQSTTEFSVNIDSLGHSGEGVARHEGKVVFVPFTLPGERVKIKAIVKKKSFIRAKLIEIEIRSPDREEPKCAYFSICGGCDWQHVPYALQLQAKVQQLADALQRIGKLSKPKLHPIVPSDSVYNYRNRIQGEVRQGQFHFKQRGSDQLVMVEQCAIAEAPINDFLKNSLAGEILQGRVEIAVLDGRVTALPVNEDHSTDDGFRQVNNSVSNQLSDLLNKLTKQIQGHCCIDLYCGRGDWSMEMARRFPQRSIIGVDASLDNIRIANDKLKTANLNNLQFRHGRVEELLHSLPLEDSFCIVDPPRAGLDERVCQVLCQARPMQIVYISCHPASLARDLAILTSKAFNVESVIPLDMFPQTSHLESLTVLTRKSPNDES